MFISKRVKPRKGKAVSVATLLKVIINKTDA